MIGNMEIEKLKTKLRGELIERGDLNYEAARKVYNGMVQKRPLLIARCGAPPGVPQTGSSSYR